MTASLNQTHEQIVQAPHEQALLNWVPLLHCHRLHHLWDGGLHREHLHQHQHQDIQVLQIKIQKK